MKWFRNDFYENFWQQYFSFNFFVLFSRNMNTMPASNMNKRPPFAYNQHDEVIKYIYDAWHKVRLVLIVWRRFANLIVWKRVVGERVRSSRRSNGLPKYCRATTSRISTIWFRKLLVRWHTFHHKIWPLWMIWFWMNFRGRRMVQNINITRGHQ